MLAGGRLIRLSTWSVTYNYASLGVGLLDYRQLSSVRLGSFNQQLTGGQSGYNTLDVFPGQPMYWGCKPPCTRLILSSNADVLTATTDSQPLEQLGQCHSSYSKREPNRALTTP